MPDDVKIIIATRKHLKPDNFDLIKELAKVPKYQRAEGMAKHGFNDVEKTICEFKDCDIISDSTVVQLQKQEIAEEFEFHKTMTSSELLLPSDGLLIAHYNQSFDYMICDNNESREK